MDKIQLGPQPFMSIMPTMLVGANVNGKPNYMTAAWVTTACMSPPMVCVAVNHARHTMKGIEENGTFSLNVAAASQMVETDYCGMTPGGRTDKSKVFSSFYGKLKTAPMAEECPANLECKVFKTVDCGSHELIIGEITEVYMGKDCIIDGNPDIQRIDPLIYSGGHYWQLGKHAGKGFSEGRKYRKK